MEDLKQFVFKSPIGNIIIEGNNNYICSVNFTDSKEKIPQSTNSLLKICANQLQEYFEGSRKKFTVPVQQDGTDFQQRIWKELCKIPFGHLHSYEDVALKIKDKKLVRAVGNAVGKNHISIIIPCHRVIGKKGDLTGYAGGLWRKQWLIEHEQNFMLNFNQ